MQPPEPLFATDSSANSVLVTGGSGVLGSAIVAALCAGGRRVVASYVTDDARAQRVARATGCEVQRVDCADENAVEALFQKASFAAVVHAAGVCEEALLLRQSEASWAQTLRVNATGAFLVTRAALRFLPRGGRLILLASRVGENGAAGLGAYAASKAAVLSLSENAAHEGGQSGIAVNCVCPGWVPSRLTGRRENRLEAARRSSTFGTLGRAEETASVVGWLLSAESEGVSGQVFHADSRLRTLPF